LPIELVDERGVTHSLPLDRWLGTPAPEDKEVIARAQPPVLDVGCGPGRHVLALAQAGIPALGVDVAPSAVSIARSRGACVLERSIFDRIPAAGRWGSALLLDGNAGIGGDPGALLSRVAALLRPGGTILIELEPPGVPSGAAQACIRTGTRTSPWFPWARVSVDDLAPLAAGCGVGVRSTWERGGRWFGWLETPR
jgi:SAM-dependent methyltransferase